MGATAPARRSARRWHEAGRHGAAGRWRRRQQVMLQEVRPAARAVDEQRVDEGGQAVQLWKLRLPAQERQSLERGVGQPVAIGPEVPVRPTIS